MQDEVKALSTIIEALDALDGEARARIFDYVLKKYGVQPMNSGTSRVNTESIVVRDNPLLGEGAGIETPNLSGHPIDIRTLKEQKDPKSAIQMAAVVGYYLSEVVNDEEKKREFGPDDLTKYCKGASFPLGKSAAATLRNAKNAGYLDAGSSRGSYRLNPVGYNLVVHRLGNTDHTQQVVKKRKSVKRKNSKRKKK